MMLSTGLDRHTLLARLRDADEGLVRFKAGLPKCLGARYGRDAKRFDGALFEYQIATGKPLLSRQDLNLNRVEPIERDGPQDYGSQPVLDDDAAIGQSVVVAERIDRSPEDEHAGNQHDEVGGQHERDRQQRQDATDGDGDAEQRKSN